MLKFVPKQKAIFTIGGYGYDWNDGGATATKLLWANISLGGFTNPASVDTSFPKGEALAEFGEMISAGAVATTISSPPEVGNGKSAYMLLGPDGQARLGLYDADGQIT